MSRHVQNLRFSCVNIIQPMKDCITLM